MIKQKITNIGSNIFDKKKKAFNERARGYRVRICNHNNLVVFAVKEQDKMIVFPTQIKVGDVIVDERYNRFYVSRTTEKDGFIVKIDEKETPISVVILEFDQKMLDNLTLTSHFQLSNSINNSVVNSGHIEKLVVQANDNNLANTASLSVAEYWKKLRGELKYTFDNHLYSRYIDEVENAIKEQRPINPRIQDSVLKKVSESIRGFIIDFGTKYLAELSKSIIK